MFAMSRVTSSSLFQALGPLPRLPRLPRLPTRHQASSAPAAQRPGSWWCPPFLGGTSTSGIHLVNEQFDPENQGKSPMLNGNKSSNPYLAGSMLIYCKLQFIGTPRLMGPPENTLLPGNAGPIIGVSIPWKAVWVSRGPLEKWKSKIPLK